MLSSTDDDMRPVWLNRNGSAIFLVSLHGNFTIAGSSGGRGVTGSSSGSVVKSDSSPASMSIGLIFCDDGSRDTSKKSLIYSGRPENIN